jgi:hypothetical protein
MVSNVWGDGHAWQSIFRSSKMSGPVECRVFRRVGSLVDPGIIEILAIDEPAELYKYANGDPVAIELLPGYR